MGMRKTELNNPYRFEWGEEHFGFKVFCGDCGEQLVAIQGAPAAHLEGDFLSDAVEFVVDQHAYCNHRPESYDPPDTADMGQDVAWRLENGPLRPIADYWYDLGYDEKGEEIEEPDPDREARKKTADELKNGLDWRWDGTALNVLRLFQRLRFLREETRESFRLSISTGRCRGGIERVLNGLFRDSALWRSEACPVCGLSRFATEGPRYLVERSRIHRHGSITADVTDCQRCGFYFDANIHGISMGSTVNGDPEIQGEEYTPGLEEQLKSD